MIAPMTKYSFVLLSADEGAFLESLQEVGVVDITRSVKPVDEQSSAMLSDITGIKGALSTLEKSSFEGIEPEAVDTPDPVAAAKQAQESLAAAQEGIAASQKAYEDLLPWGNYSTEHVARIEQMGLKVHFHKVAAKKFDPGWASEIALQVIFEDGKYVWFVTVTPADDQSFTVGEIPAPGRTAAQMKEHIENLSGEANHWKATLEGLKKYVPSLKEELAVKTASLDRYLASHAAGDAAEGHITTFTGFVPDDDAAQAEKAFERLGFFFLKDSASLEDNPPIKLKNNAFVSMFEVLTDMYGRPAYNGFDPTPFISVFFLLFFAFCMGDCGYGIILIIIGLLLRKVESFKDLSPLVVTLGAGTAVIGFLFHTFFSMDISQWEVFAPISGVFLPGKIAGYDGTMVLALIVGVVHICLALCVKTYEETKNKGLAGALGTWGWTLLIVGGVTVGALALVGVLEAQLTKWIIIVLGIVSALGIFVFNDPKRNKLANIGVGLWDTYNTATGLVGDVLSYLRLYALGLAGSMLGLAFNSIGNMILGDGSNAIAWIPFLLVVIIGHTLNVAMAALGAFVHPLRLNFLEFFKNSGYEGVGRSYNPLKK